ncbi:hypothetical protein Ddye_024942 [Dipteronia dyeriana]|uniref:HMA domain-containing protein n=1 Tax=Dipteronia dyeriana TaxID=168575 RepID=A0AAD9TVU4_9ROSI|nr:hypothetical protein Ddye_024942 [Dipteronia dyeriana]
MKRMDIFCASPASTAICSSMVDHRRSLDGRRHRTVIDRRYAPCNSSQLPIIPKPAAAYNYNYHEKIINRKSSSAATTATTKQNENTNSTRKSSSDITDHLTSTIPPPGNSSSRYLLSDKPFIDWLSESDHHHHHHHHHHRDHVSSALVPTSHTTQTPKPRHDIISSNDSLALKSSSSSTKSSDQVVVLRVSIHCKGCEGKVRKHISRMEGVTSFSIDLTAKKVTIIGKVTPLGVLESVSRVKNAQFWPSSTSSSSSLPSSSSLVNMMSY